MCGTTSNFGGKFVIRGFLSSFLILVLRLPRTLLSPFTTAASPHL